MHTKIIIEDGEISIILTAENGFEDFVIKKSLEENTEVISAKFISDTDLGIPRKKQIRLKIESKK